VVSLNINRSALNKHAFLINYYWGNSHEKLQRFKSRKSKISSVRLVC